MANYALIDEKNVVKFVASIDDAWEADGEAACVAKCVEFFNAVDPVLYAGTWVKTSYNNNIRTRFAGVGFTYDPARDAFVRPQPYPSWVLDEKTADWLPPVPYPNDETVAWDEDQQTWAKQQQNEMRASLDV